MLVPVNWLKEYIDIDLSSKEIAEKLTRGGIEVEGINSLVSGLTGVVVVEVKSYTRHPSADKLWVVKVATAKEEYQVVAGIRNYEVGDKVPLALPGAVLPGGKIDKVELRGVFSHGMLCSAAELGLELVTDDGILVLDKDVPLGADVVEALNLDEDILVLGLTPNRADCLGMLGVAREIAALTDGQKVKMPEILTLAGEEASSRVSVTIKDTDLCSRYTARVIEDIKIAPSPLALQLKLLKVGIRPVNNIVDISNLVMWETGQPLHTFDFDGIKGQQIIVRKARQGEVIITLDEQKRELAEGMLVIADQETPVALAGVMGGLHSEITPSTQTVLLESAHFDLASIRRSARSFGMTSEASLRFGRGVNQEGTLFAANRAAFLLQEIAGARVIPGVVDAYPCPYTEKTVTVRPAKVREVLGLELPAEKMKDIFIKLGFNVQEEAGAYLVSVPARRQDITAEIDLVEEVARVYGYEHIQPTLLRNDIVKQTGETASQKKMTNLKRFLTSAGFFEAITFNFMNKAVFDSLRLPADATLRRAIPLKNPLSEEQGVLRTTLLPNLLTTVKYNSNRHQEDQCFFETGKVFKAANLPLTAQPEEPVNLALIVTGKREEKHWQEASRNVSFFWLKGIITELLRFLGQEEPAFKPVTTPYLHPTQAAEMFLNNYKIGEMGAVHPVVMDNYGLNQEVFYAEIELDSLLKATKKDFKFQSLPRYPAVQRDLALVVPESVFASVVEQIIRETAGELLESVLLFDLYAGEQVPEGYKSLAYAITYRDYRETLRDEKVNAQQDKIIKVLFEKLGVTVRS